MKQKNINKSRRKLLTRTLRYATVGLISAGTAGAVIKRRRLRREGKCLNRGICKNCAVFEDCGLPRALSVRQATKGCNHG
ncbi:MAG: hypothetical protein JXA82_19805 [Sedimentisphaerales bacterium]|nr:hypothetical protein [Sedimentisphaerales bacterium]